MAVPARDLRGLLAALEKRAQLLRINREVDPRFELSAVAKRFESGPSVLFERVKGYSMPVVVGTDATRDRIAQALGCDEKGLMTKYRMAVASPVPPRTVAEGPAQEMVFRGREVDLVRLLPAPTHYEKNAGPCITSGLVIVDLPDRSLRNMSFHRMQIVGPRRLRIAVFPRHLSAVLRSFDAEDSPLPVVAVIGCETAMRLAAATWGGQIALGYDELGLAGALRDEPVDLAPAMTVAGVVPVQAEIVIEGRILPRVREIEGPFAECTDHYSAPTDSPVLEVTALTHRRNPIYQDLLVGTPEHLLLQGLAQELAVYTSVGGIVPGVRAVNVTLGGRGKFHAVISLEKRRPGDGKDAIVAAFAGCRDLKLVVVVDEDVDPFDPTAVEWAVATRFQADRDLVVLTGGSGNPIDPSARGGVTARVGFDATEDQGSGRRERIVLPGLDEVDLANFLEGPVG